jgi:hypothetical protein
MNCGASVKRRIAIYFVAGWSFVVLTLQTRSLARIAQDLSTEGQDVARLWSSFRGLLLILVVWHVVRLIQLKAFNRWLSVVSFLWATVSAIYFAFAVSQNIENPFAVIVGSVISGLLSVAGALYLIRRSFRVYAVRFVAEAQKEKNSRMMQRASQEKIHNGLRS